MTPLELATLLHETYERLAPSFGYTTRPETRTFGETTPNGRLLIAVCGEVLQRLANAGQAHTEPRPRVGEEWMFLGEPVKIVQLDSQPGNPADFFETEIKALIETRFGERAMVPVSELEPKR